MEQSVDDSDLPTPYSLIAGEIASIRAAIGDETPEHEIIKALTTAGNNPDRALGILLDSQEIAAQTKPVNQEVVSELTPKFDLDDLSSLERKIVVKKKEQELGIEKNPILVVPEIEVKEEEPSEGFENEVKKEEEASDNFSFLDTKVSVKKEEKKMGIKKCSILTPGIKVKKEESDGKKKEALEEYEEVFAKSHCASYLNPRPIRAIRPPGTMVTDRRLQVVVEPDSAEFVEFPEEVDWFLVGNTYVSGLSTCRGKRKIDAGEIVDFTFPKNVAGRQFGRVSTKTAALMSEIVRFSTKKSGEIGKLPPEWSRCLIPLVSSSKVKIRGRCVIAPSELSLMQEIVLYVSFYINSSIFMEGDKSSWKLEAPAPVDPSACPLPTLFKWLKIKPFQKAEFTPDELYSRKRSLNLRDNDDDDESQIVGLAKRRKGGETYAEQTDEEQAISEASLNKLVGTSDIYDLKEAEPPSTLLCSLWPYQRQALYWMSESEKGLDVEKAEKTLHPCWAAYRVCDTRASTIYVNIFSGEATTEFPSATQMARGGILADAMGLGKTVMTIALVLANPRGRSEDHDKVMESPEEASRRGSQRNTQSSIKGGTLIVCPMALLGQWKDELETHSQPGSISVFVHYGGDRTNDPRDIAKYGVVLTTYGVLQTSFKSGSDRASIFHRIDWYRVVLDEAHTIKSSKAQVSRSAIALTSHCRWCLTGTPIQNNLEDLYSLLCFLHVQPWCDWTWWQKLIQRPYENGDERGLRLVKAILRPLMLRRTKETKDKDGRPILVLPPANVQIVQCEQSEAERDFYNALFFKSKVKFDQFVAQGKVLHNYASILELLLRLRQCCNHPFLVVSQANNQKYADLNKLAHHFLDGSSASSAPSKAYVEEVIDGIRRGEVTECPICYESASDDPVLTPCAHRMCRECLLASWSNPAGGPCPICRKALTKADLLTCPIENIFQVDIHNNWKESSKVTELIRCLESIRRSGSGEKSIVFSQWTSFLDLLEIPFNSNRIGYLRFDGKLTQKNRERVLKEFSESRDKTVLLMSLKAGGVGLNLTAASNVFLMDPWWNPAVEEQAIMRIHRIGQKRQVRVRRFIVKDTVEERMQQVQARKQRMIAGALTDEEVRTARIEELKMLFR